MYSHIAHLDQQAFPPDPIIGLLEVYEHCCGGLAGLKAIKGVLDKSEQLILCSASLPESCLHITKEMVSL